MNMTELMEKDRNLYECDECKATFKPMEVKLVDPSDNFVIATPGWQTMCVEKDGNICGKQNPRERDGDKLLACPKCGQVHLNGFNRKQ